MSEDNWIETDWFDTGAVGFERYPVCARCGNRAADFVPAQTAPARWEMVCPECARDLDVLDARGPS